MALIKCSECGTEISDKAKQCVKCGAPVAPEAKPVDDKVEKAVSIWNSENEFKRRRLIECQHCGYTGPGKKNYNEAVGCLLFLFFIIPWLIYYYAVGGAKKMKCPACGSEAIKPLKKVLQEAGRLGKEGSPEKIICPFCKEPNKNFSDGTVMYCESCGKRIK